MSLSNLNPKPEQFGVELHVLMVSMGFLLDVEPFSFFSLLWEVLNNVEKR
jgi:hypothetical protein